MLSTTKTAEFLPTIGVCRAASIIHARAMPMPAYPLPPVGNPAVQIVETRREANPRLPRTCFGRSVGDRRDRQPGLHRFFRATPPAPATAASGRVTGAPHSRRDRRLRKRAAAGNPLVPETFLEPATTKSPEGYAPMSGARAFSSPDQIGRAHV